MTRLQYPDAGCDKRSGPQSGVPARAVVALAAVDAQYLLCLLVFGLAVIVYTTFGGFHAVVWTDVLQGVVMVGGVLILLPLAISQIPPLQVDGTTVHGLQAATQRMAEMLPPRIGTARLAIESPPAQNIHVN